MTKEDIKKTLLNPEKICILSNFKEENQYFAKIEGQKNLYILIKSV